MKAEAKEAASPNAARHKVIEQAKAFVENKFMNDSEFGKHVQFEIFAVVPEFYVNREKRTVTCLLKGAQSGSIKSKAIARTAPSDVFNIHIGKAIALAKALKQEIPHNFAYAPQPQEAEVGDKINYKGSIETLSARVPKYDNGVRGRLAFNTKESLGWLGDNQFTLVDDSKE